MIFVAFLFLFFFVEIQVFMYNYYVTGIYEVVLFVDVRNSVSERIKFFRVPKAL
jgi:hypothetical protein